jgi:hypothetical protein
MDVIFRVVLKIDVVVRNQRILHVLISSHGGGHRKQRLPSDGCRRETAYNYMPLPSPAENL